MTTPAKSATSALLDGLRAAAAEHRAPDAATRTTLAQTQDPALARRAGKLLAGAELAGLRPVKVAVAASFTVGSFEPLLRACLVGAGIAPAFELADYGAFEMTLAAGTFGSAADVVAVLLDASFFLPGDWSAADPGVLVEHIEARTGELTELIGAAAGRGPATLIVHTVPPPVEVTDTFISVRARAAIARAWHLANAAILGLTADHVQVVAVDLEGALASAPVPSRDARLHRYADMPYTDAALLVLAGQVRRVIQARCGLSKKVLALDLDNTLWGGVLGEVGAQGLELGGLYPGNCYLELQRTVRRLREQGVILVLASKNDPELVDEALTAHPEVVLRPADFSVRAVNWDPKPDNLRSAAQVLGLSTEAFLFVDDSEFESGHVRSELPEVAVVTVNSDPAYLTESVLAHGWFDVMALTDTDRKRPELYRTRALRSDFSAGFSSAEDFLHALKLEVEIAPADEFTVGRVAQLAARTNQFNLTGIRFDEAATARMGFGDEAGDHLVVGLSVSDRFGNEGLVGAIWVERGASDWRVLNFVLSCRVLSRGVELAAIAWLAGRARDAGAAVLEGRFTKSQKNGVAADFWVRAGFISRADDTFALDLHGPVLEIPKWITLREREQPAK